MDAREGIGGNAPPVLTPPTEDAVQADLEARFPEIKRKLAELTAAADTYPAKIVDEEVAGALQAFIKQCKTNKASWKGIRGDEKRPWSTAANIVQNFFGSAEETVDKIVERLVPRWEAYLEGKKIKAQKEAEERAEFQRQESARLQREADMAAERKRVAEAEEAAAVAREAEARRREAEAKEDAMWAEARAELAFVDERRMAKEKRERETSARAENVATIRDLSAMLKQAERLNLKAEQGKLSADEGEALDGLILEGRQISKMGGQLSTSPYLDEEQTRFVADMRVSLLRLRGARGDRMQVEESEARAKAKAEEQARNEEAERQAGERRKQIAIDEERMRVAREERATAEAAAEVAKQEAKQAKKETRAAMTEARDARDDQKDAGREAELLGEQAEKTEARADRMDRKIEGSSSADFSRTRGEHGTVGSLARRWTVASIDNDKVSLDAIRGYLHVDAISAAVTRFKNDHQHEWQTDVNDTALPGVVFERIEEARVK